MAMFNLSGRNAVVTGGSSGIGQAICIALANAGANVATISLTEDDSETTRTKIEVAGRRAILVRGDTSNAAQVAAFADQVETDFGSIDIWINNAGRLMVKPFLSMTDEEWYRLLDTNLHGYYHGCREAAKRMVPAGFGRIINVTSVTAMQPISNASAYVTGKGGVLGLTKALAVELASCGITVNAIAPGAIHSRLNADVYTPEVVAVYEGRIPAGRIGQPGDIGPAAVFLASDEASYVTGQQLAIDGGMTINGNVNFEEKEDSYER